jgi:hypothetical protein
VDTGRSQIRGQGIELGGDLKRRGFRSSTPIKVAWAREGRHTLTQEDDPKLGNMEQPTKEAWARLRVKILAQEGDP